MLRIDFGLEEPKAVDRALCVQPAGEIEEMGGDKGHRFDLPQEVEDHVDDLDGFRWVGPRAELVEKDHRTRWHALEQAPQAYQLGAQPALGLVRAVELDDRGKEPGGER